MEQALQLFTGTSYAIFKMRVNLDQSNLLLSLCVAVAQCLLHSYKNGKKCLTYDNVLINFILKLDDFAH